MLAVSSHDFVWEDSARQKHPKMNFWALGFKLLSLSGPLIVFCQTGKLIWNVFRMFKFLQALYLKQSHSCAENNLWSYHALLVSQIFFFDLEAPFFLGNFLMITIFFCHQVFLFYNVHISYEPRVTNVHKYFASCVAFGNIKVRETVSLELCDLRSHFNEVWLDNNFIFSFYFYLVVFQ